MAVVVNQRAGCGKFMEQLTVTNAVQVLSPALYKDSSMSGGAQEAFLTNYGNPIRWTYNGTTPSTTVGHVLPDGGILILRGQQQLALFKCFRVSADSEITVTYEYE